VLDADTLDGCRRGDPEAQHRVFLQYKDHVFSLALHFFEGDHAAAEDVTQEVFVKVFRAIASFREDARFSTWLYRIVSNACQDEHRRRRRVVLFGTMPQRLHPVAEPSVPHASSAAIHAALAKLSPKLRIAVLLRYFEDLSYEEIARSLEISEGTVASRLNRAHAALASELAHLRNAGAPA
jgi:RNA polymerase sigma-70 factor (ECF subfamily)